MDAVKYLKEQARMCSTYLDHCPSCPLHHLDCCDLENDTVAEQKVEAVEKWSNEHPQKTRMSEFLKQHPNAPLHDNGLPFAAPCHLEESYHKSNCKGNCSECREKYWLEEIE